MITTNKNICYRQRHTKITCRNLHKKKKSINLVKNIKKSKKKQINEKIASQSLKLSQKTSKKKQINEKIASQSLKLSQKTSKKKLVNYLLEKGKKQISEKVASQSFKLSQKNTKKSHSDMIKFSILDTTPVFKIIFLKKKIGRKKSIKEIPAFFSKDVFRRFQAIKYLVSNAKLKIKNKIFYKKLHDEILLNNSESKKSATELKENLQKKVLQNKSFFKYYRW